MNKRVLLGAAAALTVGTAVATDGTITLNNATWSALDHWFYRSKPSTDGMMILSPFVGTLSRRQSPPVSEPGLGLGAVGA